jgi:transcription-repair coupling factor (superfamily II helicase)
LTTIERILDHVAACSGVQEAFRDVERVGRSTLVGLSCSAKAMALARMHRDLQRSLLVIVPSQEDAEALLGDLEVCLGEERVFFFPETEVIPYDDRSPHVGLLGERITALAALGRRESVVAIATARAVAGRLVTPETFRTFSLPLSVGQELPIDELSGALVARGFHAERLVEEIGTFAVRGGLVDLYPFGTKNPIRVEFFGDEIESIREFDAGTQRTVESLERVDVLPQRELLLTDETIAASRERGDVPFDDDGSTFVDGVERYLPRVHPTVSSLIEHFDGNGVVVVDEPARVVDLVRKNAEGAAAAYDELRSRGHDVPAPAELFLDEEALTAALAGRPRLDLTLFRSSQAALDAIDASDDSSTADESASPTRRIQVRSQETFRGNFAVLRERIRDTLEEGQTIHLLCDNQGQLGRLEEMLDDLAPRMNLVVAPLRNGFALPERSLVVLTDHELFARTARRYRAFRHGGGAPIHDYSTLKKGDFVVHVDHGIGRYDGIHLLETGEVRTECLRIRYQEESSIYVPIDQINLVQKYVGGDAGEAPPVARLGSGMWERAKARARKAVEQMAGQLVEIHAARAASEGHAYPPDNEWQREMEASFIYEETPDQRKSTDAVKKDLMASRPMDRLICGDVGYGKTEVAVRAAFKAVSGGKQVAVLVPTTILAQQHLNTFQERLRAYPVKIGLLSRFCSAKEQKETVEKVRAGTVDILIGTHRILSKDVQFRDLGLVVVDEEQRFGVRHKERLKELRTLVDVLTLTATPIPRTLNMALSGLREISVIETPPPNKLPIVTEVVEASDELVKKAILREVQRGGQVFFVHNRVQSIESVANRLRESLPELRFDVAHGQMHERQLEKVMMDFLDRKSDVLVSTMIIESGLDLPNVNTILINRADTFGLAQLYQLRGRVGRSNHRAFAYLLVPEAASLSDIARKRLRAIEEFSDLGSGFRLAMRDMELRGAGNFLGPQQSGHVHAVGYDLYVQMLREAIADLRGEDRPAERLAVQMDVETNAYLPEEYISDPDQRILFYKRLADLAEVSALLSLAQELRDRYGRLPEVAENLLQLKELRILAELGGVERVKVGRNEAELRFARGREPSPESLKGVVQTTPGTLSFRADGPEGLRIHVRTDGEGTAVDAVAAVLRAVGGSDTLAVSHSLN